MRKTKFGAVLAALGAVLTLTTIALAQDQLDVQSKDGTVTVNLKKNSEWHLNKEYPWSVTVEGKKVKLTVGEHDAKATGVPLGKGVLAGAVCRGTSECKPFHEDIIVK